MIRLIRALAISIALAVIPGAIVYNLWKSPRITKPEINSHLLKISPFVKSKIDSVTTNTDYILGTQIVTVDFNKNTISETYIKIDNPSAQILYDAFVEGRLSDPPIFTTSTVDNARVMRLIRGEFICVPFKESTAYKYAPAANVLIASVCAIGIPPNKLYQLSGILTIYLSTVPTPEETRQIYLFARDISYNIANYNNLFYDTIKSRVE